MIAMLSSIQIKGQIKFPDRLEHASSASYLIDQNQIKGTHWYVATKSTRNSITYNKRNIGMLVTWVESGSFITARFEGANTLDVNWQNDANWQKIIAETDTLTYSINADTASYSYIAQLAYDADTSTFAWYADTTNFSYYADTSQFSYYADTSNFAYYSDTSQYSFYADTSNFALYADTSQFSWYSDTSNFSIYADTANFVTYSDTANYSFYSDTSNIALNANVDSIMFKGQSITCHTDGKLVYDTTSMSLVFNNDIANFCHNLGYELVVRVYNESGSQIDDGTAVTLDTVYHNGIVTATIKKAGMASIDSLQPIGITTVDIPNDSYGIVTLLGEVKGLNTSIYGVGDASPLWVSNNGAFTAIKPSPPNYALQIGYIFYADNDSGSIYINPLPVLLDPQPHFNADTSNINQAVTINTINVYEYLPFSMAQIRNNIGFTVVSDSVQVLTSGYYDISLGMSFNGNPTTEIWRYGAFKNGEPIYTKSRSTSSNATGDVSVSSFRYLTKNNWISFKIRNQSSAGDPTVIDINFAIDFRHE